ncbi:tripartite motif-containing protein 16-like [Salarias fasciatus]|uniref:tripartite motif-containing protein 16-like n=1 Tax=Salarias fasciatus TaxID=181472 RepID=UPI0011766434|nr:tripartite motif-containing protein 16-like isoform X1 [Salarias fasciatus]XP_029938916.1 tripartite motif-containing protein 16-like isoform X2 [Salarias fasciatus]XP_029938928.1 tripartite motif-containing protein 16-like [Salarias fasciatus]XP_029938937.1 tripartite motif-containing protein 16-like [Salarias fasciatus]XP_029938965.1 tripartite motif-containing protein 16-like [Salarias fasciatus]XP_029938988.1 tripartite motif-containing protein 16-like [Salarias fasciatus]XP_029939002.
MMDQSRGRETVPAAAERSQKQKKLKANRLNIQQSIQQRENDVKLLQQQMQKLQLEITELKRKDVQLEQLEDKKDHNRFPPRGTGEKPSEPQTRAEFLKYSQQITLDPNSAHRRLLLSKENRKVAIKRQDDAFVPHPDRFTYWYQVLGRQSLTGRSYWEVERRGGGVFIAVTYKNISRAGSENECILGFNDKSWALKCDNNSYMFWYNKQCRPVSGPQSSRVGVYLDHKAGILSFYSVSETMTLLHRVQTTFTQPLHAGLWLLGSSGVSAEFNEPSSENF